MKTLFNTFAVCLLTCLLTTYVVEAQPVIKLLTADTCPPAMQTYTVVDGKTLRSMDWDGGGRFLALNPGLEDRAFTLGEAVPRIFTGDVLCIPFGTADFFVESIIPPPVEDQKRLVMFIQDVIFLSILAAFAGFAVCFIWLSNRVSERQRQAKMKEAELNLVPVAPGEAVMRRGFNNPLDFDRAVRMALARRYEEDTRRKALPGLFVLLEIVRGRAWGVVLVWQLKKVWYQRRLGGERAYKVKARFPDGGEEYIHVLWCGNDIRYDGVALPTPADYFRFESDLPLDPWIQMAVQLSEVTIATPSVESSPADGNVGDDTALCVAHSSALDA